MAPWLCACACATGKFTETCRHPTIQPTRAQYHAPAMSADVCSSQLPYLGMQLVPCHPSYPPAPYGTSHPTYPRPPAPAGSGAAVGTTSGPCCTTKGRATRQQVGATELGQGFIGSQQIANHTCSKRYCMTPAKTHRSWKRRLNWRHLSLQRCSWQHTHVPVLHCTV